MMEFRCDRCKKIIKKGGATVTIITAFNNLPRIDLCEECEKELNRWIYGEDKE